MCGKVCSWGCGGGGGNNVVEAGFFSKRGLLKRLEHLLKPSCTAWPDEECFKRFLAASIASICGPEGNYHGVAYFKPERYKDRTGKIC